MTGPATETAAGKALLPAAVLVTTTLYGPAVEPVAAETLNVTVVPVLPDALFNRTFVCVVVPVPTNAKAFEYWLRPVPVSVTVVAAAPGTRAVVAFVAVMVGATIEASPIPSPPVRRNEASLPPLRTVGLSTVMLHNCGPTPVSGTVAVIEVALVTEEVTSPVPGEFASVQPVMITAAPGSKPAPAITTLVDVSVAVPTIAEGVRLVTP
jgi:hypothetical protein